MKIITADLSGQAYLDWCARVKAGELEMRSVSGVTGKNGTWRVNYEEVQSTLDPAENLPLPEKLPTSPSESEGGATGKPAPLLPATAIKVCFDCGRPYDGLECTICAPLARILVAALRLRRDRQLEKRFLRK